MNAAGLDSVLLTKPCSRSPIVFSQNIFYCLVALNYFLVFPLHSLILLILGLTSLDHTKKFHPESVLKLCIYDHLFDASRAHFCLGNYSIFYESWHIFWAEWIVQKQMSQTAKLSLKQFATVFISRESFLWEWHAGLTKILRSHQQFLGVSAYKYPGPFSVRGLSRTLTRESSWPFLHSLPPQNYTI